MENKIREEYFKLIRYGYFYSINFNIYNSSIDSNNTKNQILEKIDNYLFLNNKKQIKKDILEFININFINNDNLKQKIKLIKNNEYNLDKLLNNLKKNNYKIINNLNFLLIRIKNKQVVSGGKKKTRRKKIKSKKIKKKLTRKRKINNFNKSIDILVILTIILINMH